MSTDTSKQEPIPRWFTTVVTHLAQSDEHTVTHLVALCEGHRDLLDEGPGLIVQKVAEVSA